MLFDHFHLPVANAISEDNDVGREFSVVSVILDQGIQEADLQMHGKISKFY